MRIRTGTNREGWILGSVEPDARPQKGIDFFYLVGTVFVSLDVEFSSKLLLFTPFYESKNYVK